MTEPKIRTEWAVRWEWPDGTVEIEKREARSSAERSIRMAGPQPVRVASLVRREVVEYPWTEVAEVPAVAEEE